MEMDFIAVSLIIFEIIIFIILMFLGEFILKKLKERNIKILNPKEYFPEEEIHNLRQIYFLIMMGLLFIDILYSFVFITNDWIYLALFDIILSLYVATTLDKSTWKNKILVIFLVPFGAMTYIVADFIIAGLIDITHIIALAYFIKVYYDSFMEYTRTNGLGIAIILLFVIIFFSFLLTQVVEMVNPLDSLVMVSNAFTSNGYAVLGNSITGKLDSLLLVWGGYILSGVGTATLTAGILIKYFSERMDEYDEKIEELKELIEKNR